MSLKEKLFFITLFVALMVVFAYLNQSGGSLTKKTINKCTNEVRFCSFGSARKLPNCDAYSCPSSNPMFLGQLNYFGDIGIRIVKVIEDSRCPVNDYIKCIWAGTVKIEAIVTGKNRVPTMLSLELNKPLIYEDRIIVLFKVSPDKETGESILSDYLFYIRMK